VGVDHLAVVQLVDGVGADDDERVGIESPDEFGVAPERVGGAGVPAAAVGALERGKGEQAAEGAVEVPRPAVGEVVGQRRRVELHRYPDVGDLRVLAVAQREVHQPVDPGERDGGLGALVGEQLEPPSGSTGEDEDEDAGKAHRARLPGAAAADAPGTKVTCTLPRGLGRVRAWPNPR
jgi:hypothetical protein